MNTMIIKHSYSSHLKNSCLEQTVKIEKLCSRWLKKWKCSYTYIEVFRIKQYNLAYFNGCHNKIFSIVISILVGGITILVVSLYMRTLRLLDSVGRVETILHDPKGLDGYSYKGYLFDDLTF